MDQHSNSGERDTSTNCVTLVSLQCLVPFQLRWLCCMSSLWSDLQDDARIAYYLKNLAVICFCQVSIAGSQMRVILRWWSSQPNVRVTRNSLMLGFHHGRARHHTRYICQSSCWSPSSRTHTIPVYISLQVVAGTF
ncbi:uncharacterized protein LOC135332298 isoform X1 [Halichondria panicea]|uniref:uncharacterized protein LOC135332298 isoform X1 n=1 Tax=Halichondria panicea TaxID=6063 RepID=UPI00312BC740